MAAGYHIGWPPIWCLSLAYGSSLPLNGIPHSCVSLLHSRANIFLNIQICSWHPPLLSQGSAVPMKHSSNSPMELSLPRCSHAVYSNHIRALGWLNIHLPPPSFPVYGSHSFLFDSFSLLLQTSWKTELKHHLYKSSLITSPTGYPGHPCIIVFVVCYHIYFSTCPAHSKDYEWLGRNEGSHTSVCWYPVQSLYTVRSGAIGWL